MATTIRIYVNGSPTPAVSTTMQPDRSFSALLSGLSDGTYTFEGTAQEDGKGESARVQILTPGGSPNIVVSRSGNALAGNLDASFVLAGDLFVPATHALSGDLAFSGVVAADLTVQAAQVQHALVASISFSGILAADLTVPTGSVTPVSDSFTGANGALTAPWATVGTLSISQRYNNQVSGVGTAARHTDISVANQYAELKLTAPSAYTETNTGPCVRMQPDAKTFYGATLSFDDTEGFRYVMLFKFVNGVLTPLTNTTVGGSDAYVRIEASGTTLKAFTKAAAGDAWGTAKVTATDASIASGNPGVWCENLYGDDFAAGGV